MVRAGVVQHPSKYSVSGYNEIQNPPERYAIINKKRLMEFLGIYDEKHFRQLHREWVNIELKNDTSRRNPVWSESIAVGKEHFVKDIQQRLAGKVSGRSVISNNVDSSVLKEPQAPYSTLFTHQKGLLSLKNTYFFWH